MGKLLKSQKYGTLQALIPESTNLFMDFLIYVVVPIAALLWALWSDQPPQYAYRG